MRPYLTAPFRRAVFNTLHGLSHAGIKATVKLVTQRYVWPSVKFDCREWTRSCIPCQRSKVQRHVTAPLGSFPQPSARFDHVNIDIVILPVSEGYRYCLTCVDRFTRWPEAIPLYDQEAVTVARAFFEGWICRFGTLLRVTTDQGRQFESYLFKELNSLLGSAHFHTTAYHPAANGMVERFHRQFKAAIRCYQHDRWTEVLPIVLLGIRSAWKEDLKTTSAELVYGGSLRLPGEFLSPSTNSDTAVLVKELREYFRSIGPSEPSRHGTPRVFVFKYLENCKSVFVRHDASKAILQQPYDGPYVVVSRNSKTFTVDINGKHKVITINRLKPAFVIADDIPIQPDRSQILPCGNIIPADVATPRHNDPIPPVTPPVIPPVVPNAVPLVPTPDLTTPVGRFVTRFGRRVKFPDRLQVGFS